MQAGNIKLLTKISVFLYKKPFTSVIRNISDGISFESFETVKHRYYQSLDKVEHMMLVSCQSLTTRSIPLIAITH